MARSVVPTLSLAATAFLWLCAVQAAQVQSATVIGSAGLGRDAAIATATLSSRVIAFASQVVGSPPTTKTITLSNTGTAALHISSIAVSGGQPDNFPITYNCGTVLNPNETCSISVAFVPVSASAKTATLKVTDDASGSPQRVTLSGIGLASSGFVVSASSLTFPTQAALTSSVPHRLTLTNYTASAIGLKSIAVTGVQADDFSENTTCVVSLAARASCNIYVTFAPVSAGTKTAVLRIDTVGGGSPKFVSLSGPSTPALTRFSMYQPVGTDVQGHSADTKSPTFTVQFPIYNPPTRTLIPSLVEKIPSGGGSLISKYVFQTQSPALFVLTVTLKPGAALPLGPHTETLNVNLCVDVACTNRIVGSPQSIPVTYEVIASEGKEYTQWALPLNAVAAAWDVEDAKFCIIRGTASGQALSLVDPISGAIVATTNLSGAGAGLAVSDDGQFAYVGLSAGSIQRYRLPDLTPDITISIGQPGSGFRMAVAPRAPHTLAVAQTNDDDTSTLMVFDDTVMRKTTFTSPYSASIAWGGTSSTLYSRSYVLEERLDTLDVSLAGFKENRFDTALSGFAGAMHYEAGLLYSDTQYIFDPVQHKIIGHFPLTPSGRVAADAKLESAFVWWGLDSSMRAEDLVKLTDIAVARFPGVHSDGSSLFRWGTSGLAFITYEGNLFVMRGTFVNSNGVP